MSFEKFREEVQKLVGDALLETPPEGIADLAVPCFSIAKKEKKDPSEIAKFMEIELSKKIRKNSLVKSVKAAGPYLNFYINEPVFSELVIKEILGKGEKYGSSNQGKGKAVVIDYSSPNIAKPMSVGHLRSTVIGQALYNIHKFLGYKTIGDNHIADWGTHLGNLLYAYNKWGKKGKIKKDPIPELLNLYVKFHEEAENKEVEEGGRQWFKKLEDGDRAAVKMWKLLIKWSETEFERIYKRLGIKFDYQLGESFYVDMARQVIGEALKKGIAKREQGAIIIQMNGTPLIIQKSDESTLYATRDLAAIKYRMQKFKPHQILYVVGSEQKLYFRQVFFAAQQLGYTDDRCVHIDFGLISLPSGRMSTRAGRVVFLEDFINETVAFAEKIIEEKNPKLKNKKKIAEMVALGAIKYSDLSRDRIKDIIFREEEAISFDGDTGPYLQYTCVRAESIIKKSRKKPSLRSTKRLSSAEEVGLIKKLSRFPYIVESSLVFCKPHIIANYLYDIASKFNEYYHKTRIIGTKSEKQRLALVLAFHTVLKTGLSLLGIGVPERM